MIRLVLVDNHRLFRVSLRSLIASFSGCQVMLDVASIKDVPVTAKNMFIDLIIFDPNSAPQKSFDQIQEYFPLSRVLILTDSLNRTNVNKYMDLGVAGFFSKEDSPDQLEKAIHEICVTNSNEDIKIGTVVRDELINNVKYPQKKKIEFSDREMQVLRLVCLEKTNAEISDILGLSVRTVESHRRRMIDKTDCRSIIGVILKALDVKSVSLAKLNNTNQAS